MIVKYSKREQLFGFSFIASINGFVGSSALANCCIICLISFIGLIQLVELIDYIRHDKDFISPLQLIVICDRWTKIFLIFREDRTIFCEGEWSQTTKMHDDYTYIGLVGLIVFSGIIGISLLKLAIGLKLASGCNLGFGRNQAFGCNLASGRNLGFGRDQALPKLQPPPVYGRYGVCISREGTYHGCIEPTYFM